MEIIQHRQRRQLVEQHVLQRHYFQEWLKVQHRKIPHRHRIVQVQRQSRHLNFARRRRPLHRLFKHHQQRNVVHVFVIIMTTLK